ncbi:acetoin utilization protein [Pleomorphomonas diazotrophica]|uniref:Acetoin utilization protein n=1 Tax=Pleomorphomonas diazotrophica TaxID=1166257 RepID=A0A1I4SD89_9HYPH|nr:histone deacetylase family protein [Pleomorphomonas diazotrophica]PKR88873.1 acetoin utilization protein [Pleomorphomonas diazotrophica]SFM62449.1 Acetoin utilization deacetylase AcuC [Pleomorphomonas diazotrophica]
MRTLFLSHPRYRDHLAPDNHPEQPGRIVAIERQLEGESFQNLIRDMARPVTDAEIQRVHPAAYVDHIRIQAPHDGLMSISRDTILSNGTYEAARLAAGAACLAVDEVMTGLVDNAFSAARPPGHHASARQAMGFCFFNHAAIAARHAQAEHGAERVAIVDFDVHHGNGTQNIFYSDETVFYASIHQQHLFPGTGEASETGVAGNILNVPLAAGANGAAVLEAMTNTILPAVTAFHPDLLVLSAGFDAHYRDPLGDLNLVEADYAVLTRAVMDVADRVCGGRVVSLLEGGYDLDALGLSAAAHVSALMGH